ncbi:MAG: pilus assembly protein PilM [Clostridiales bacterium]|nr:pilus assembly protein PilM [Clostridiales bacterium]
MSILGIDIGSRRIKVVEAKSRRRPPSQAFLIDTPAGAVHDGEIKDPAAVAQAIRELLEQRQIRAKELHFAIKTPQLASRSFSLPAMKPEEVAPAVEFDLSQSFPGIQQTNTIGYIRYSKPGDPLTGLAVFCPTRVLDGYVELAKLLNIPLLRIDAGFNACARALMKYGSLPSAQDAFMLLEVGVESSQVVILSGGRVMLSRFVPSGAHSADQILASRFGVSEQRAEEIRSQERYADHGIAEKDLPVVARLGYQTIAEQIKQTLDFYQYNMGKESPVSGIYVTGGGSLFEGLEAFLSETFALPVQRVPGRIGELEVGTDFILTAVGLLTESPQAFEDVNLVPDLRTVAAERSKKERQAFAYWTVGGVFGAFCVFYGGLQYGKYYESRRQQALNAEMKAYAEVNVVKRGIEDANWRIESADLVMAESQAVSIGNTELLDGLKALMPDGLFIRTYTAEGPNVITLSGVAKTRADIAEFMNRIRGEEAFGTVSAGNISARLDAGGAPTDYSFALTVNFSRQ